MKEGKQQSWGGLDILKEKDGALVKTKYIPIII